MVIPDVAVLLHDGEVQEDAATCLKQIFARHSDPAVNALMQEGYLLVQNGDFTSAIDRFDQVVARDPQFAEGWNRRATARYLARQYQASIEDCHRAIALNPYHFGALTGLGLNYLGLKDVASALRSFHQADRVHPGIAVIHQHIRLLESQLAQQQQQQEGGGSGGGADPAPPPSQA